MTLDSSSAGKFNLLVASEPAEFHALYRHYCLCKKSDPTGTSALICLPSSVARTLNRALTGLREIERLPANLLFDTDSTVELVLYQDAPTFAGVVSAADLPPAIASLRAASHQSGVTFMLDAF